MNALAQDLSRALDPVALARGVGIDPDPWQADLLRTDAARVLVNACRQSGKSTVVAALSLHEAVYRPGSLSLILTPSLRQSQETFRKVLGTYRALGRPVPPEAENALSLALETGSRVVCLPGQETTIRGFSSVSLLVVDEAARVPDGTYYAVRPMLAVSGGRIIACSTPFGGRGWWAEAWRSDDPWQRYRVPATDVPRIGADFLAEERRTLGEWWYRQEYECEFLDAETQAFRREDIERAFDVKVTPWIL